MSVETALAKAIAEHLDSKELINHQLHLRRIGVVLMPISRKIPNAASTGRKSGARSIGTYLENRPAGSAIERTGTNFADRMAFMTAGAASGKYRIPLHGKPQGIAKQLDDLELTAKNIRGRWEITTKSRLPSEQAQIWLGMIGYELLLKAATKWPIRVK